MPYIVLLVMYITCLGLGLFTGLYLGVRTWFDLKVSLPVTIDYDREGRLKPEYGNGRLAAWIKKKAYMFLALFVLMFFLVMYFMDLPSAICFLIGLCLPILSQSRKFDRYERESTRAYLKKYAKYMYR